MSRLQELPYAKAIESAHQDSTAVAPVAST